MPTSLSKEGNLPESIEAWLDPGYAVYAVSVYHQLHCLNRIRKTFYPEKFFLNESEEDIIYHKSKQRLITSLLLMTTITMEGMIREDI